jgi:hypothetical protein
VLKLAGWLVPILMLAGRAGAAAPAIEAERAGWIARFDTLDAALLDSTLGHALSNEQGEIAWGTSYHLTALLEMMRATGDTAYASRFVRLADAVVAARDDLHSRRDTLRQKVLKAWGSTKYSGGRHMVWAVHSAQIAAPLAGFAALVRADSSRWSASREPARRLLAVAEDAMAVHDRDLRPGPRPTEAHLIQFDRSLPFNQQSAVGRAWLFLDQARPGGAHRERLFRLANFLHNRVVVTRDSALIWSYLLPRAGHPDELDDISHASIGADFIALCCEARVIFTPADLRCLERTFLTRVVLPDGRIAATLDGSPADRPSAAQVCLWGRLARHDPRIRDCLMRLCGFEASSYQERVEKLLGTAFVVAALSAPLRPPPAGRP